MGGDPSYQGVPIDFNRQSGKDDVYLIPLNQPAAEAVGRWRSGEVKIGEWDGVEARMDAAQAERMKESPTYAAIYDDLYAKGYNKNALGWGVKVGLLPWMLEHCDFRSVIDVGCGRGQDVAWLLERGKDAHGVDVSAEAIAGMDGKRFSVADLSRDTGWDRRFDAVVSSDVLEHLRPEDVPGALRRLVRSARKWVGLRIASGPARSGERFGYGTEILHPTVEDMAWWVRRVEDAIEAEYEQKGKGLVEITAGPRWFVVELEP